MIEKSDSKGLSLATASILGQPPSWQAAGDLHYRIWMTHTPHGTVIVDPLYVGSTMNEHISYTGAAISLCTHTWVRTLMRLFTLA